MKKCSREENKEFSQINGQDIISYINRIDPRDFELLKEYLRSNRRADLIKIVQDISKWLKKVSIIDLTGEEIIRFSRLDPILFQRGSAPEVMRGVEGYKPSGALYTYKEELAYAQEHEGYYPLFRQVTSALSVKGIEAARGGIFGIREEGIRAIPVEVKPERAMVEVNKTKGEGIIIVSGVKGEERVYVIKPALAIEELAGFRAFWDEVLSGVRALGNVGIAIMVRSPLMDPIMKRLEIGEDIKARGVELPSLENLKTMRSTI